MRGGNSKQKKQTADSKPKWPWVVVGVIVVLFLLVQCSGTEGLGGNTALISVDGVILTSSGGGLFAEGISSSRIVEQIHDANENPLIKAIVVEINSPGGSAVASQEIANALKASPKPTVSYIRDAGASGGYWVATATDKIYASEMSIVGSVGVTAAQLEYAGLLEEFNITYRRTTAGKFKDIGTPFREQTPEEADRLDQKLSLMHDYFINEVKTQRNLDQATVAEISQADFYIGLQALELGLIDAYGGKQEAVAYIEEQIGDDVVLVDFAPNPTLFDLLAGVIAQKDIVIQADIAGGGISLQ